MFQKEPDDDFFDKMNPFKKLWLYESWLHEQEKEEENKRNQAILAGSFYNPEMAQKMIQREKPQIKATEEDLEKTLTYIKSQPVKKGKRVGRRHARRVIKE